MLGEGGLSWYVRKRGGVCAEGFEGAGEVVWVWDVGAGVSTGVVCTAEGRSLVVLSPVNTSEELSTCAVGRGPVVSGLGSAFGGGVFSSSVMISHPGAVGFRAVLKTAQHSWQE